MIKKAVLSFLLANYLLSALGQEPFPPIVPPAPNAASLGKFGDVPVSTYTGIPNISVPLYTVSFKNYALPIAASYHAAGIKVEEEASWIGLGWSLEAGATITRTIRGLDDLRSGGYYQVTATFPAYQSSEDSANYNNYIGTNSSSDLNYFNKLCNQEWDGEPDLFVFNLPGYSGRFIIDKPSAPDTVYTIRNLSQQALRIKLFNYYSGVPYFQITTPEGIEYTFPITESSVIHSRKLSTTGVFDIPDEPTNYYDHPNISYTSWHVSTAIYPTGDTVQFEYEADSLSENVVPLPQRTFQSRHFINNTVTWRDYGVSCSYSGTSFSNTFSCTFTKTRTKQKRLKTITFPNGRIEFVTENRDDIRYILSNVPQRLKEIIVKNGDGRIIKSFLFAYDYFVAPNSTKADYIKKRLKLLSITEKGYPNKLLKPYTFEYDTTQLPDKTSIQQDHYGYFNGTATSLLSSVTFNVPNRTGETVTYTGGDRSVVEAKAKACILKKITYPTGGYTVFEFESNSFSNSASSYSAQGIGGGLRIKKLTSYDNARNLDKSVVYEYLLSGVTSGKKMSELGYHYFEKATNERWCSLGGVQAMYQTDYDLFCNRSAYSIIPLGTSANGSLIGYDVVTQYFGENGENGKTVFEYFNNPETVQTSPQYPDIPNSAFAKNGKLKRQSLYSKDSVTNSYTLIKTTDHTYTIGQSNKTKGVKVYYCQGISNTPTGIKYYDTKSEWVYLDKTVETSYSITGSLADTIDFYYENATYKQLTKQIIRNSRGEQRIITFKYPHDFYTTDAGNVYKKMTDRFMINDVIEQRFGKSSTETLNGTINTFTEVTTGRIFKAKTYILETNVPVSLATTQYSGSLLFDSRYKQSQSYSFNSAGNLLFAAKTNDVVVSYLWGYKDQLPIAEAINAVQSSIAYTSFETNDSGNWSLSGTVLKNGGVTGYRSFSGTVSRTLGTGNYVVTGWSKVSTNMYVNGMTGTLITTKGNWRLYQWKLTNVSTVQVQGNDFDEVRLCPAGAQMSSFVHDPLVGIIAKSDPNNIITYYEYDELGRLIVIRDANRNVVKKICYAYSGQTDSCKVYYSQAVSQSYTRNNCQTGYVGTSVSYTIPAGVFISTVSQADADLIAQAAGQGFANVTGACVIQCTTANCVGEDKKCINNVCETGIKVYTASTQVGPHLWECTYHYEWSDGSWSQNYIEQSPWMCAL
jgi:YD repeat-containing protein